MTRFILLTEIYEDQLLGHHSYMLREVLVNPEHIIMLRDDPLLKEKATLKGWPDGLDKRVAFCKLSMNTSSAHSTNISVVGELAFLSEKLEDHG